MVVKLKYLSPGKKKFVIQSATGSKLIIDKVLKNLWQRNRKNWPRGLNGALRSPKTIIISS
jgi:hypothetical protein